MFQYPFIDLQKLTLAPWNIAAKVAVQALRLPFLAPLTQAGMSKEMLASADILEKNTRQKLQPHFNITRTKFRGITIDVTEETILSEPFCKIIHFKRHSNKETLALHIEQDPTVLIVAPMFGHYSTLMRGTVEAMLSTHNVYITEWIDAKTVPLTQGFFDLEDQIEVLVKTMRLLGSNIHVIGITQASLSVLCAISLLAQEEDPAQPLTMTLIGGPIDARGNGALLSQRAQTHSLSWFRQNQIQIVPAYYVGAFRLVCPGDLQLLDRMSMTLTSRLCERSKYFDHLVRGDDDTSEAHDKLYDEFLAVMDVPEEFYIQMIERAYQRCDLPNGSFTWRGLKVDPSAIKKTALLTVEGELDDLSPPGHTQAALTLCSGIPEHAKRAHLEIGAGHYSIFTGRKWRNNIEPIIHAFIREHALPMS